jgi:hypothetical protein
VIPPAWPGRRVFNCVTTATAVGIQRRTAADGKASSGAGLRMIADAFGLPDKEEIMVRGGVDQCLTVTGLSAA